MAEMDLYQHDEVTCREFVELVTDYWEAALPAERAELVEEHLVMCDWCKTYLDQMRVTVDVIPAAIEPEPVPAETREALLTAFHGWSTDPKERA